MKGILRKKDSGWMVQYFIPPTTNQLGWINSDSRFNELPLLDNGYVNGLGLYDSNDGLEVEFEIVEQYAKII